MPLTARPWPVADRLFRQDPRWRGSDDAYTVDLGGDRTLWLFGDTFVGEAGAADRVGAAFVRNSIGVQQGSDPTTATMEYAWGPGPGDFFRTGDHPDRWLWPLDGVRLGDRLLLFFMDVVLPAGEDPFDPLGVPFRVEGWQALLVDGVDGPPGTWRATPVTPAPETGGAVLGTAVLVEGDELYLYAFRSGTALLARCAARDAAAGDLTGLHWWTGSRWGGAPDAAVPVVEPAQTEFTVHRDRNGLCLVDVAPFDDAACAVNVRRAARPEGPWSAREPVWTPDESTRRDAFVYAGKAHPELSADGLAVTYASNGKDFPALLRDETLYYPRFVVITGGRTPGEHGESRS